jgi:hypothetical protein
VQRGYDKARANVQHGRVVGSTVFGNYIVPVLGLSGKRSHVKRRITPAQAEVVERIVARSARGQGYTRIAKDLNAEHAPAPRTKAGRIAGGRRPP